ncbi:hypothetical protein M514_01247 [Trichuris suis]|uniref:Atos-like conserved domain-containing protein n=1 Tax=Trichuris suis TaxID=68888 RepID=A0A085NMV3_9BILA|nr:hypothetical protein M514_01247 [Trichuris suis]
MRSQNGAARADPQQIFVDLGMLIMETRLPEPAKAPKTTIRQRESSSPERLRKQQIRDDLIALWTKGMLAEINVSLNLKECRTCRLPKRLMLEKWLIKCAKNRQESSQLLPLHFLTQAVRSYLHFSQLSAWMIQANGPLPFDIAYEVSTPMELPSEVAMQINNVHLSYEEQKFPDCEIDKDAMLSVKAYALCRGLQLATFHCTCCNQSTSGDHVLSKGSAKSASRKGTEDDECQAPCLSTFNVTSPNHSQQIGVSLLSDKAEINESLPPVAGQSGSVGDDEDGLNQMQTTCSISGLGGQASVDSLRDGKKNQERGSVAFSLDESAICPASSSSSFTNSSLDPGSSLMATLGKKAERGPAVGSASRRKLKGQSHSLNHGEVGSKWSHEVIFNARTGLPLSSSPAPMKKNHKSFNFDCSLTSVSAIRQSLYSQEAESASSDSDSGTSLCKSAPERMNLLGSFEESALKGRITPFGVLEGFTIDLAASGAFYPVHVTLPVTTFFYNLSEDAPLPYFGHCSLETLGRKGYHVPLKGSIQVTLFNPQGSVVKMFIVQYNLADMPPCSQTFVRQRTYFMPTNATREDALEHRSWLHYLIHLRFASSRSRKIYLHSDIRMLFARKSDVDAVGVYSDQIQSHGESSSSQWGSFELRSFNEMPRNPKFSPRKMNRDDIAAAEWESTSQETKTN